MICIESQFRKSCKKPNNYPNAYFSKEEKTFPLFSPLPPKNGEDVCD